MNKAISLLVLIKSMSKAEKRYFRLYSNLQSGEKEYISLYRLMESEEETGEIQKRFTVENPGGNFEVAVKHLNSVILDCIVHLRRKQDMQARIFNYVTSAEVLFERGLVDDSFAELRKARKLAEFYEYDLLSMLIRRKELKYMSSTDFAGITEKRLVDKQMKLNELLKYARNANQHVQLYDIIKYRLTYKGLARSDRQQQHLNDLVLSELHLVSNSAYKTFETEKLHLLFQATYFLNSGNYKTALRFYQELIDLFEENKHLMLNPPIHYFNALKGILDSLQSAELYKEMPYFIKKVREIESKDYPQDFLLNVHTFSYFSEFSYYFQTGDIESAKELRLKHEESLSKRTAVLDLRLQLQLNLNATILALVSGDSKDARKGMKKILGAGKVLHNFPDYKVARLINLLIQAELGNYDYLENEMNSLKRSIAMEKNIYQYRTEKLLFKFIKRLPLSKDTNVNIATWNSFQKDIEIINMNKYERPLLKTFDFVAWIESKLTSQPFMTIIRNKSVAPTLMR